MTEDEFRKQLLRELSAIGWALWLLLVTVIVVLWVKGL